VIYEMTEERDVPVWLSAGQYAQSKPSPTERLLDGEDPVIVPAYHYKIITKPLPPRSLPSAMDA